MVEEENKQVKEEKMESSKSPVEESTPEDMDNTKTEMDVVEETVENNPVNSNKDDKDSLYEEIEIPEGVSAEIVDDVLTVKKDDKEIKRKLVSLLDIEVKGNKVVISAERNRKLERKLFGTFKAHINNMIKGLTEGFEYKLRVSNVHFPMNVSYDAGKNLFTIKNFLGEKKDRIINGIEGVDVKIDGEDVIVSGYDIEKGAKVRNKDRRVYQDGIFIIQKPGRVYLE